MRVFVSCPYLIQDARRVALNAIQEAGHEPVQIYELTPQTSTVESLLEDTIKSCDAFISIHGHTYGTVTPWNDQSYSEWEYLLARTLDIPVLVFLLDGEQAHRLRSMFRQEDRERMTDQQFWRFREAVLRNHLCVFGRVHPIFDSPYRER